MAVCDAEPSGSCCCCCCPTTHFKYWQLLQFLIAGVGVLIAAAASLHLMDSPVYCTESSAHYSDDAAGAIQCCTDCMGTATNNLTLWNSTSCAFYSVGNALPSGVIGNCKKNPGKIIFSILLGVSVANVVAGPLCLLLAGRFRSTLACQINLLIAIISCVVYFILGIVSLAEGRMSGFLKQDADALGALAWISIVAEIGAAHTARMKRRELIGFGGVGEMRDRVPPSIEGQVIYVTGMNATPVTVATPVGDQAAFVMQYYNQAAKPATATAGVLTNNAPPGPTIATNTRDG